MNGTSTANRPRRHHKQGSPWLPVLRKLWARGWSPARIAATLSGLSASACRQWLSAGGDDDLLLDALLAPDASPLPWTPRQVRHHARRGRKANGPRRRPDPESNAAHPAQPRRNYALSRGWGRLLPEWVPGEGWVGGVDLSRRDVDVLCTLRDEGPLTRGQIADALQLEGGRRRLRNRRGRCVLGRLRRAGLVIVISHSGGRWNNRAVYALAGEACPPPSAEIGGILKRDPALSRKDGGREGETVS